MAPGGVWVLDTISLSDCSCVGNGSVLERKVNMTDTRVKIFERVDHDFMVQLRDDPGLFMKTLAPTARYEPFSQTQ